MKSYQAAFYNSVILISIGIWGYAANNFSNHTAVIPIGFGLFLLISSHFLKKENKLFSYLVFGLTAIVIFALLRPLLRNIEQKDLFGITRVVLEIAACTMAIIIYFRNIKIRK